MSASARIPVGIVDAVGGGIVSLCAVGCAYLVFFHADHATQEIGELTSLISSATEDLATVRAALDRQQSIVKERQAELNSGRHLPTSIPLEEYLHMLSQLATQNKLRVVKQNPLSSREYPGLLEQRYAYEVLGSMPDLTRFFKDIEEADFWVDIAFVKIEQRQADPGAVHNASMGEGGESPARPAGPERLAVLTVSLFSAVKQEPSPSGG